MKKVILSIGGILLIIILAVSAYFILYTSKLKSTENTSSIITPTTAPTTVPTPTTAPAPSPVQNDNELYPVYIKSGDNNKYGYIDNTGNYIIQPLYDFANDFNEGAAIVTEGDHYLVINTEGTEIFKNDNVINSFHNGAASYLATVDDLWLYGYINQDGQVIVDPQFTFAGSFNQDGQAYVALPGGKTYELIDKTGAVLESYEVDLGDGYVYAFDDGYIIYYDSPAAKYGVISVKGQTVLKPKYSDITYLGQDLFAVKSPDIEVYQAMLEPAALYNVQTKQFTDYKFYDLQYFNDTYTSAADDTSVFFIDTSGREITSLPSYDGGGYLVLHGNIVKAEIDGDLTYYRLDNTILWQSDNTTYLSSSIMVKQIKFKPLRSVIVRYPYIEGLLDSKIQDQINEQLETIFTEARANITKEDQLTVSDSFTAQLMNNLLMICLTGYDYPEGQAHGSPIKEYYFIDLTTGEFYELTDLFKKDSGYQDKINQFISSKIDDELKSGESMYFEDAFTGITNAQHFYLGSDSLTIYFYPYDIAAYANGFPEFTIPFDELMDYIDTEGAFWQSFHK